MRGTGRPTRCSGRMNEVELFLRKARDVVYSIDPPWVAKHIVNLLTN
jgi:hypothetical protein